MELYQPLVVKLLGASRWGTERSWVLKFGGCGVTLVLHYILVPGSPKVPPVELGVNWEVRVPMVMKIMGVRLSLRVSVVCLV